MVIGAHSFWAGISSMLLQVSSEKEGGSPPCMGRGLYYHTCMYDEYDTYERDEGWRSERRSKQAGRKRGEELYLRLLGIITRHSCRSICLACFAAVWHG